MAVFGSASWVTDDYIEQGPIYYALFSSTISWLRERPDSIGIEPKKPNTYQMDSGTSVGRMVALPFLLMSFGVLGMGLGVWMVRRR